MDKAIGGRGQLDRVPPLVFCAFEVWNLERIYEEKISTFAMILLYSVLDLSCLAILPNYFS